MNRTPQSQVTRASNNFEPAMPRVMEITTPLATMLLFPRDARTRGNGRLERVLIDLLSPKKDVNIDESGKNVRKLLPTQTRYFNGFARDLRRAGGATGAISGIPQSCALAVVPDARPTGIFQERRCDIIKKVFGTRRRRFQVRADGHHRQWTYCVQYRETDSSAAGWKRKASALHQYDGHNGGATDSTASTTFPGYDDPCLWRRGRSCGRSRAHSG